MTRLILCADDYGLSPGVSRGILRLLEAGRLSATSCMTASPNWPAAAVALRGFSGQADIGLHLTLTDQAPLGAMPHLAPEGRLPPVRSLLLRSLRGRLDAGEIAREIERQIDAFEAALGRPPDFLDGHQHVQQFPVIRDVVIDIWRRRLAPTGAWLRSCDEPTGAVVGRGIAVAKALLLAGLGRGLRRRAAAAGIPLNDRFSGVHDFSQRQPYGALFARFVDRLSPSDQRLVVMCHPGEVDDELRRRDPVTHAREDEMQFFLSTEFHALLAQRGLTLQRFR